LTPAKLNFLNKLKQILAKVNLKLKVNTTLFHTQKTPLVVNNIKDKGAGRSYLQYEVRSGWSWSISYTAVRFATVWLVEHWGSGHRREYYIKMSFEQKLFGVDDGVSHCLWNRYRT